MIGIAKFALTCSDLLSLRAPSERVVPTRAGRDAGEHDRDDSAGAGGIDVPQSGA
jgi:hypothetical protein